MGATLVCVDAFTTEAFRGNPAAVCLLDEALDDARLQMIAAELNLSETAFVVEANGGYGLRWFTPTVEVVLCGHGTLAGAHVLWETGRLAPSEAARFSTRWKGELTATRFAEAVELDLPAAPSPLVDTPVGLAAALGAAPVAVGVNDLHHVVELADEAAVCSLTPDLDALIDVDVEAVTVTARSDDPAYDFVSRYFAPRHGITEDPVTGSAHTSLGPWWADRLEKTELVGHQVSRRGGVVTVIVGGDDRVTLRGHAVTIWRGELQV